MNKHNKYFRAALPVCPKCGMDSGRRLVSDTTPEKYFVRCETCGFITKPHADQSAATHEWNDIRKEGV